MTYLSSDITNRFKEVLHHNNMQLDVLPDHAVITSPYCCTVQKIERIIASMNFCSLVFSNTIDREFSFILVPDAIPEIFRKKIFQNYSTTQNSTDSVIPSLDRDRSSYYTLEEIHSDLQLRKFIPCINGPFEDRWALVNNMRYITSPSLSNGLSQIIKTYARTGEVVLEIGAGVGYTFHDTLFQTMVRTQANNNDCHVLSTTYTDPIYETNIEELYHSLVGSGKKIPLLFALNVFDTLSPSERKRSFKQLIQLQKNGDHLLILLDTNPCLEPTIEYVITSYPDHAVFAYFSEKAFKKFSLILVPWNMLPFKLNKEQMIAFIHHEARAVATNSHNIDLQQELHKLQQAHNLQVIYLEDFFIEQVKKELVEAGYTTDVYYQSSFNRGDLPRDIKSTSCTFIYKSITDSSEYPWNIHDEKLLQHLQEKRLSIPSDFDEKFLQSLEETEQKIFGVEILVIAATKV